MKTFVVKEKDIERRWLLVDAEDKVLGRLAAAIARILMGKHRPMYTTNLDCGDFVVVINAEKIRLTGKKLDTMGHKRYSGYPGGQTVTPIRKVLEKHPERVLMQSVKRMLPKTKLGDAMYGKLKVYAGASHPHEAQKPEPFEPELK